MLNLVGVLLLVLMMSLFGYLNVANTLTWGGIIKIDWQQIPILSYLGGVIGALYVAINSHVLTRIGALKTALLVISGQMVTGVMFDVVGQPFLDSAIQLVGVILIIAGVYYGQTGSKAR